MRSNTNASAQRERLREEGGSANEPIGDPVPARREDGMDSIGGIGGDEVSAVGCDDAEQGSEEVERPIYLYRHYNDGGELLYIGISCDVKKRTSQHKASSDWFCEGTQVVVSAEFPTRDLALKAESEAIKAELPKNNHVHILPPESKGELMKRGRRERKEAGLKRAHVDDWVLEEDQAAATEAVNRALKPFKERARRQLKKWKQENDK